MRPLTRATRSSRVAVAEEATAWPSIGGAKASVSKPTTSNRSSRTGTPFSDKDKKPRHRMTDLQLERLEALYTQDTHPTREQKQALGEAVGMWVPRIPFRSFPVTKPIKRDTRTVTVWFQNRRQLSKKNSMIVTAAPHLMSRQPLTAVLHQNSAVSTRAPSMVSSVSQSSFSDRKTPQLSSRRELWEYLPSSPPTSQPVSAVTSAMPSPLARRFPRVPGTGKENRNDDSRKRKPILEWACAQVTKRQRREHEKEYQDLDITETDGEAGVDDTLVDISALGDGGKKASDTLATSTSLAAVTIPSEYNSKFSPDVVLGASLLLTFQYSKM
jgi:hypothetical protein